MFNRTLILLVAIIFFGLDANHLNAQTKKELKAKLESASEIESMKIYSKLVDMTFEKNNEECEEYAKELKKLGSDLQSKKMESKAYGILASIYYDQGKFTRAINNFEKELEIRKGVADRKELAKSYYNLGSTCLKKSKNRKAKENFEESYLLSKASNYEPLVKANQKALMTVNEKLWKYSDALRFSKKYIKSLLGEYEDKVDLFKEKYHQEKVQKEQTTKQLDQTKEVLDITKGNLDETENNLEKTTDSLVVTEKVKEILVRDTVEKSKKIENLNLQQKYKDIQLKRKEDEIAHEKRIKTMFIIGFVAIFVLLIFIAFLFLKNKKINKALTERNIIIEEKNKRIEKQHKSITESIKYAERIQTAVLPEKEKFDNIFKDYCIYFNPRDVVSGDFYFMQKINNYILVSAIDCTGHGVPGAFMSMLGIAFMNDISRKREVTKASQVLDLMRQEIKHSLSQTGKKNERKDGMDMALCVINTDNNMMQYAGAHNPLVIIRNNEIIQVKADRMPVGIHRKEKPFTNHEIEVQKGDTFYIFSDGFIDQLNGETKEKYKSKPFKKLLLEISDKPMKEQKKILEATFYEWKRDYKQIDDIIIIGFKYI